jgi:hypothetical protein
MLIVTAIEILMSIVQILFNLIETIIPIKPKIDSNKKIYIKLERNKDQTSMVETSLLIPVKKLIAATNNVITRTYVKKPRYLAITIF